MLEAWEQGFEKANPDDLADLLEQINHLPLAQRVGALLESLDLEAGGKLRRVLDDFATRLSPDDEAAYRQLFPGCECTNLVMPWLVYVP